jgi:UDP-N-acetylmuramate--alanine ligase
MTDLSGRRNIHVIGAGGAGMSAISTLLAARGHDVHGSDLKRSPATDRLNALGIPVAVGHSPDNLGEADMVVISSAIPYDNPELTMARTNGIQIFSRAEMLYSIFKDKQVISVSGTHGKTTTTSMLSLCLVEAGLNPSYLVGGDINESDTNAVWGSGDLAVVEADESDGTFLVLGTDIAVITNIEPDHLDYYGDFDSLVDAFGQFASHAKRTAVVNGDDPHALAIAREIGGESVGTDESATWHVVNGKTHANGSEFLLARHGELLPVSFRVPVIGEHNLRNAALAAATAIYAGGSPEAVATGLARFGGVARRFQRRGTSHGVVFIDDYAHLPGEVSASIKTARLLKHNRVVVVFQPHRYSRISLLAEDFGAPLALADAVIVTDIYPAGEPVSPGVTGKLVADAVARSDPDVAVHYIPRLSQLPRVMDELLQEGDLCITMGAGDITTLFDEMLMYWS